MSESNAKYCLMHRPSHDGVQLSHRVETVDLMRDSGRATPADPSGIGRKSSKSHLRNKKNGHLYFNEAFAVREEMKKIPPAAGVWVEMKTNVIVCHMNSSFHYHTLFNHMLTVTEP